MLLCSSHILTTEGRVHLAIRRDDIAITVTLLLLYCIHSVHVLGPDREKNIGAAVSSTSVHLSKEYVCLGGLMVITLTWILRDQGSIRGSIPR